MRLLFLFIGEQHQMFHALPIAAEMAQAHPHAQVEIAVPSQAHARMVGDIMQAYPGFAPAITRLDQRPFARSLLRLLPLRNPRLPLLLASLPWLRRFDAIIVPERTTTIVRPLLPTSTALIFTPHGAGDRAIMLDPRDAKFDFVLVAGAKSERRLLDAGTIRPGHYAVNGYVKLDLMHRLRKARAPLFDNGRPTVLYAPHFRRSLSSWDRFGLPLIDWFARQDRYNLVVAPHYRLFAQASAAQRDALMALAVPGKIHVDLSSDRLFDMSYTGGADIYVGDVSSQVYEFLATPRPCLFLNAHGADWRGDPDYLFWTLGDVVDDMTDFPAALDNAVLHHPAYQETQRTALADSIGGDPVGAARRGADAILAFLANRRAGDRKAAS